MEDDNEFPDGASGGAASACSEHLYDAVPYLAPRRPVFLHCTGPVGNNNNNNNSNSNNTNNEGSGMPEDCDGSLPADGNSPAHGMDPSAETGTVSGSDSEPTVLQESLEALFSVGDAPPGTIPVCSYLLRRAGVDSGAFRPGQQAAVLSVLQRRHTLAVFPTGWGKSLCFQIPMLVHRALFNARAAAFRQVPLQDRGEQPAALFGVVVSPLLALMADQADRIAKRGALRTAILSSATGAPRERAILAELAAPSCGIDLVFVSPERIVRHAELRAVLEQHVDRIAFICIDEVHCVSQWAFDFRPAFMYVHRVLARLGGSTAQRVPFLCLTATAAPAVVADLQSIFGIERTVTIPYERGNLQMECVRTVAAEGPMRPPTQRALQEKLLEAVIELPKPMLVYVQTRVDAEEFAKFLSSKLGAARSDTHAQQQQQQQKQKQNQKQGPFSSIFTSATHKQLRQSDAMERPQLVIRSYHAALDTSLRRRTQQQFMQGAIDVLIATVAFGMGIDKPDIRSVVHASAPSSLESYVQETGRAGRDGLPSTCRLLYNPFDYYTLCSRALSAAVSLEEMRAVVAAVLGGPTTRVGERLTLVPTAKIAEELMMSEETVETVVFMLLAQEGGALRELRGTATMAYRIAHAAAEIVAPQQTREEKEQQQQQQQQQQVLQHQQQQQQRKRNRSTAHGVGVVLAQLEVLDDVFELCRRSKRIDNVIAAANGLGMSLHDFLFRLDDLIASGFVVAHRAASAYLLALGDGFAAAAAPAALPAVAERLWRAHSERLSAQPRALRVMFAALQSPSHAAVRAGLEWDAQRDAEWQPPARAMKRMEAVAVANDFVEKNRPRIRSAYDAARALVGVLPKSLARHGRFAGELPLGASWYVGSPHFGKLREFEFEWVLKVLAPHRLDEASDEDAGRRLPTS